MSDPERQQHESTDPNARSENPQQPDAEGAEEEQRAEAGGEQEGAGEQPQEAESPEQALQRERDELYDRLQRTYADYRNYIKRAEQNLANEVDRTRGETLKSLVPVIDQFDRALEAEPSAEEAKSLYEGMRIVREEMLKTLEQLGVRRIDPEPGDRFDPHIHEAMMRQSVEGIEPNHVAQAFGPGYVYKSRTLRPAQVAVVPEPEQDDQSGGSDQGQDEG